MMRYNIDLELELMDMIPVDPLRVALRKIYRAEYEKVIDQINKFESEEE